MKIIIHERIKNRHPDIDEKEIIQAINNTINWKQRLNHNGEIFGIGITSKGKFVEYTYIEYKGKILVYHAQEATSKSYRELGLSVRRRHEDR